MAWTLGDGILAKGAKVRFAFKFGNHDDVGAQFVMARPSYAAAGVNVFNRISITEYSMSVANLVGVRYSVVVTNSGDQNCPYTLYGGGVV